MPLVLAVALVAALWCNRDNVASVVAAIGSGAVVPILFAAGFESLRIVFHAYAYTRSFRTIGARVPLSATVPAWFKSVFMNTVLPSGGTSGLAAVVDAARLRGVAVGSATSAVIFTQTCFYSAMLLLIVVGFVAMARAGTLLVRDVLLGCVMGVVALAFLFMLAMGHLAPGALQRLMRRVEALVARLCRALRLRKTPEPWADQLVHSFSSAATELSRHPRRALSVFLTMVVAVLFDMLAFFAACAAFGVLAPDALFGGYVTALVFNSFSPTPGGVGVVEALASAALVSYGYTVTASVSCVLVYRAFMYWLPFVVGAVAMYVTGAFGKGGAAGEAAGGGASEGASGRPSVRSVKEAREAVASHLSEKGPVFVRHRRSDVPMGERVVSYVSRSVDARSLTCAVILLAVAVVGFVTASLPAVSSGAAAREFLSPVAMVAVSYVVVLCAPGVALRNQATWLVALAALLLLGFSTALAGRGPWATAAALLALAFLVGWHGTFESRGMFENRFLPVALLVYALLAVVVHALVGAVVLGLSSEPPLGVGSALWAGLQSIVAVPSLEGVEFSAEMVRFFVGVRVTAAVFTVAMVSMICIVTVRRVVDWRSPARREERRVAKEAADEAAAERRAARKAEADERRAAQRDAAAERRAQRRAPAAPRGYVYRSRPRAVDEDVIECPDAVVGSCEPGEGPSDTRGDSL